MFKDSVKRVGARVLSLTTRVFHKSVVAGLLPSEELWGLGGILRESQEVFVFFFLMGCVEWCCCSS